MWAGSKSHKKEVWCTKSPRVTACGAWQAAEQNTAHAHMGGLRRTHPREGGTKKKKRARAHHHSHARKGQRGSNQRRLGVGALACALPPNLRSPST